MTLYYIAVCCIILYYMVWHYIAQIISYHTISYCILYILHYKLYYVIFYHLIRTNIEWYSRSRYPTVWLGDIMPSPGVNPTTTEEFLGFHRVEPNHCIFPPVAMKIIFLLFLWPSGCLSSVFNASMPVPLLVLELVLCQRLRLFDVVWTPSLNNSPIPTPSTSKDRDFERWIPSRFPPFLFFCQAPCGIRPNEGMRPHNFVSWQVMGWRLPHGLARKW